MSKYASGKFAKRISDRSGMAFPYNEMVQEWTGVWVHTSEYEPKHPQLEPLPIVTDPQSLQYARSQIANSTVFTLNILSRATAVITHGLNTQSTAVIGCFDLSTPLLG